MVQRPLEVVQRPLEVVQRPVSRSGSTVSTPPTLPFQAPFKGWGVLKQLNHF